MYEENTTLFHPEQKLGCRCCVLGRRYDGDQTTRITNESRDERKSFLKHGTLILEITKQMRNKFLVVELKEASFRKQEVTLHAINRSIPAEYDQLE